MEQPDKSRDRFPLYPFLLAIYPIVFLYAHNTGQTAFVRCLKPAFASCAAVLLLLIAGKVFYGGYRKAGIAASALVLLFFSYGQVVDALVSVVGENVRVGLVATPVWMAAMVVTIFALKRTSRPLTTLIGFVRVAAVLLLAMPVAQIASYKMGNAEGPREAWGHYVSTVCANEERLRPADRDAMPDIYYIIVDAYSRSDVLANEYGYDNSPLINYLSGAGFYVASDSTCNYRCTSLSLSSALNHNYLQQLVLESKLPSLHTNYLYMLSRPKVVRLLRQLGYKIVQVTSGYETTRLARADTILHRGGLVSNEFDGALLDTTVLRAAAKLVPLPTQRECVLGALDDTARTVSLPSPKFVFAHLTVTHIPYYVRADGSAPDPILSKREAEKMPLEEYKAAYIEAVTYADKRLETIVNTILTESRTPPIIVLQSDHGDRSGVPILNAYYLPGGGGKHLYPSITPVNTFRVIFNEYFGAKLPLLKDRTYTHREGPKNVYRLTPYEP